MKIYFAFFNLCYEDNFIYSKSNYKKKNIQIKFLEKQSHVSID